MALVVFENGFQGTYEAGQQTLKIGMDALLPYDMTYGALSACLYSNYLKHAAAAGIEIRKTEVYVDGKKRDAVPATLETVDILFRTDSDADEEALQACLQKATETCSMFQTIACVAQMNYKLEKF